MINQRDLRARAAEWALREDVVEKDYLLGWVLAGIGTEPALRDGWAFKGGTCLKKCYLETFRFSEDLDFTVFPGGPVESQDVLDHLDGMLRRIGQKSGVDLAARAPRIRVRPNGSLEVRIYYRGPAKPPARPASVSTSPATRSPYVNRGRSPDEGRGIRLRSLTALPRP